MKTARAISSDVPSNRRAQPARQARQQPPRSSGSLLSSFGARDAAGSGLSSGQVPPDNVEIFPAITHFADAITALPKELVRHFTLLKEVDAKIFAPEETLGHLVDAALNAPLPLNKTLPDSTQISASSSVPVSARGSVNGSIINGQSGSIATTTDETHVHDPTNAAYNTENIPRRQLFRQCAYTMQEMLLSLDEKNHVISTATEALNKQLRRIDECFPHIEREVGEEARYGSTTHWAYAENRMNKPAERSRRDVAPTNHISREAQLHADEAAARSESRKQAMLAKKGRAQQNESDFDDHHHDKAKGEVGKRTHGNTKKGRPADAMSTVGLGITNGGANSGPSAKRRKVDKGSNGGIILERSLSGVFGANGTAPKGKVASPSETPVPEASKKKSKGPAQVNGQPRKRTVASHAMSPSLASSPIHSTFADSKGLVRGSPVPTSASRPPTGRARQNSTQSVIDNARQRPSPAASNKQNGNSVEQADLGSVAGLTGRSIAEVKATMKESAVTSKGEHMIEDMEQDDPEMRGGLLVGSRKDGALKCEDTEVNGDGMQGVPITMPPSVMTTKSGRASKPSTPAMSSFPEPVVRSRSSRSALDQAAPKRSHKKGAGQAAQLLAAQSVEEDAVGSVHGEEDDVEVDADEPTYCYCNGVSYGEMVACDYDGCAKEWFHLDCVGLKSAPGKARWYCDDCKEIMKGGKRFNGK